MCGTGTSRGGGRAAKRAVVVAGSGAVLSPAPHMAPKVAALLEGLAAMVAKDGPGAKAVVFSQVTRKGLCCVLCCAVLCCSSVASGPARLGPML